MTPPNKTSRQKLILSNRNRMNAMYLHKRKDLQFIYQLSLSPFEETALEYANKLHHILNQIEYSRALNGHETVPDLDPNISIEIGKTVIQGLAYLIKINGLTTHMVVCGATGSGKTNVINLVSSEAIRRVPAILIDHKDEGLRFVNTTTDSAYIPIEAQCWNCLAGIGNQEEYIRYVSSLLVRLMALMPVTANAVQAKLISLCSDPDNLPSIADLARIFFKLSCKEHRAVLSTAARGFEDLATNMGRWATVRQGQWPFDKHPLSVIKLKDCPPAFEHFVVAMLFKQLTDRTTSSGHTNALKQLVVFDEGRGFFGKEMESGTASGRSNLQMEIMTKFRSYGGGIIIGTQSITGIQQAVIDNAGIFIALQTNSDQEAKACCRRLGLDESRYMELINMPVGTAWIISPWCREPVKIRIPFRDLGHYPSEVEIVQRMKPLWDSWNAQTIFAPTKATTDEKIDFRTILGETQTDTDVTPDTPEPAHTETHLNEITPAPAEPEVVGEYFALLRSIESNPQFGTSAHYKALGFSGGVGNRIKTRLLDLGLIETVRIPSPKGGRPRETLKLTPKSKDMLK